MNRGLVEAGEGCAGEACGRPGRSRAGARGTAAAAHPGEAGCGAGGTPPISVDVADGVAALALEDACAAVLADTPAAGALPVAVALVQQDPALQELAPCSSMPAGGGRDEDLQRVQAGCGQPAAAQARLSSSRRSRAAAGASMVSGAGGQGKRWDTAQCAPPPWLTGGARIGTLLLKFECLHLLLRHAVLLRIDVIHRGGHIAAGGGGRAGAGGGAWRRGMGGQAVGGSSQAPAASSMVCAATRGPALARRNVCLGCRAAGLTCRQPRRHMLRPPLGTAARQSGHGACWLAWVG